MMVSIGVDPLLEVHRNGAGWSAIARLMNETNTPTAHGGARYVSTVRAVVIGAQAETAA